MLNLFKKNNKIQRDRRHFRYGTLSTVLTAVVAVVFVLLNVAADALATRYPLSVDLTAEGNYSLSEECTKVAETVKGDVEIVLFIDRDDVANYIWYDIAENYYMDLSEEANRLTRKLETALSQIAAASDGKVSYTFLDPNQNPAEFAAYEKYNVTSGDILFISGDRSKVSRIQNLYAVDASSYSTTGSYSFYSNIEKLFASKIYALQGEHIVQVLVGHQENQETIAGLQALYEMNGYTFEEIDITASKAFNEKAEIMLIAAPTTDYSDAEIKRVEEWVRNDGVYERDLMVFVDPTASCPNLYQLLSVEYGIQVTDELVWETDSNRMFEGNHFYTKSNVLNTKYTGHAATEVLGKYLYTPTARRLTANTEIVEITEPSQENAIAKIAYPLNKYPESTKVMPLDKQNGGDSDAIAVNTKDFPLTTAVATYINYNNDATQMPARGTVAVFGCPNIAAPANIQNTTFSNETLLLDTIDTLAGIEDEVTITSQTYDRTYLNYEVATQKQMLYIFVVGLPGVVLITCLVVFLRRKYL